MDPAPLVDLSGLQSEYRTPVRASVRWFFLVSFLVILTGVTLRLLDGPDVFDVVMSVFQVAVFGLLTATNTICAPAVFLQTRGLRTRRFLWPGPLIPWTDVANVQVQGRWQDHSSVIHRDGRLMPLVGMPLADAQLLADALQAARGDGT